MTQPRPLYSGRQPQPAGGTDRPTVELVIPNFAEYFMRNDALELEGEERDRVIAFGGNYECDHAVFWSRRDRVLLLPEGLDEQWFADTHEVLGLDRPPIVVPRRTSGLLVADLLADEAALARLDELTTDRHVRVLCFGPTRSLYDLEEHLRAQGRSVELDCTAADDYWASLYLDSKLSCLDMARAGDGIRVARGMTVSSGDELRGALPHMLASGSVIARGPHGVAGDGSAVVRTDEDVAAFLARAEEDTFFTWPLIVQEFIEHAEGVGCPAADFHIGEDGVTEMVPCALTVADGYSFRSVAVGDGALPQVWHERLREAVDAIGAVAHRMGYRGWICVDCVAGSDDRLYVTEVNARRSGSAPAGALLRDWSAADGLTIAHHFMIPLESGVTYADDIAPALERVRADGTLAFVTSVRGLEWPEPIMAVLAAAPDLEAAEAIVQRVVVELAASTSQREPEVALSS